MLNLCDILKANCILTNQQGIPIVSLSPGTISCKEIPQKNGRKNVNTTLPNGEVITLQKVFVQKSGLVIIEITGPGTTCRSQPLPFSFIESFILCAPEGTELECNITEFDCIAQLNCQNGLVTSVDLFFAICQDVEIAADMVISIPEQLCNPRQEININSCPITPPNQCPAVFPTSNTSAGTQSKVNSIKLTSDTLVSTNHTFQKELACVSVKKVYDWIVRPSTFQLNFNINDLVLDCDIPPCDAHLFVHAAYICEGDLQGQVLCGNIPVEGAQVSFSAEPNIVTFSPDPTVTDANGNFDTIVTVPPGTPPTPVTITANTFVSGLPITTSLDTIVECHGPCVIELFTTDVIDCDGFVEGRVMCGGRPIEGAVIEVTSDSEDVTFAHDQITTGTDGNFFVGVTVEPGTPLQTITITASTIVEGQNIFTSIDAQVVCSEDACVLTLEVPANISCEATITGSIFCGDDPVSGADISFSSFPNIVTFSPNPVVSLANGTFSTTVTVPENTPFTSVLITATTTVNGQTVSTHVGTNVECPGPDQCPCKFRIGIQGNSAPATVNITQQGVPSTLAGTINVTAVQCFITAPMCNPAVDNFNITFGSGGTTINFIQGRRIHIDCTANTARVHGTAMASGNLFSGIFDVEIILTLLPGNTGTWQINASDLLGNTFTTTFTAPLNPITFVGDCNQQP
ncbi:BMQ_0737 family morphogenetic spore coat protein [Anaerobacillus alkalidiazotrophicus]|uniref:hypothetical protein n=1 Tax=Anaerobacillus alkalidiazotrophicus TaxID=472963 RepID=UPI000A6AA165|nr:hypothetical protein [Anaerobacillus alkalidiazotrophicus]